MIGQSVWIRRALAIALLVFLGAGVAWAEVKLDYRQRQAVQRQERNMAEVEKKIAVIVQTEDRIAAICPAFINRDNMKNTESPVASHKSTYTIRQMLVQIVD